MNKLDKYKIDLTSTNDDKEEFVSCIVINEEGMPLKLLRRNDTKLDKGKYDFCSGHMKQIGETPLHAILRELTEELRFDINNIKEIYRLGQMETPHKQLKGTITHCYCLVTNLTIEQINEKIKQEREPELEFGVFLDSIDKLESEISDPNSNWRFYMTDELKKILEYVRKIVNERKIQKSLLEK